MNTDISLCTSVICPKRHECKRNKRSNSNYQSYFNPYEEGKECNFYL